MGRKAAHYTARVANDICTWIAMGCSLEKALEKVGYLAPSEPQVFRWLSEHEDFKIKYDTARQMQADKLADRTLDFVDEVIKDPRSAPAYKVATEILKWHASIRNGKIYNPSLAGEGKSTPLDATKIKAEIARLERELGVASKKVVNLVKPKVM